MAQPSLPTAAELAGRDWELISHAARHLEEGWQSGDRPQLGPLVESLESPLRHRALAELVKVDQEYRWESGQPKRLEEYLSEWPELSRYPGLLMELAEAECLTRGVLESVPTREELRGRFPQLVDSIDLRALSAQAAREAVARPQHIAAEAVAETEQGEPRTADASESLPPGYHLEQFVIQECLGRGAMGTVYLAQDEQLDRLVAIKVPHDEYSQQHIEPLLAEARAVAKLKHTRIVPAYHFGRHPEGWCYFVMEYVEGRSLKELLTAERPSAVRAAELVAQVAETVHHAHKRGFVHRDLKPGNILVDADGKPRVVDFGLALHESVQRDRPGESAGTLAYMAPEQVRGESHRLDGRTDVWALGVVLYEMLTGRRPFEGTTREQLEDEILNRQPKPPRQVADGVPRRWSEYACAVWPKT